MREWLGTRMILEFYLGDSMDNPDDQKSGFKTLRKNCKGLKLAYMALSQQNWEHCKILQIFGKPCWSWFTKYHKTVKSAMDSLGYVIDMSSRWMESHHLRQMAMLCSVNGKDKLDETMYWAVNAQETASKAWEYNLELLGQRSGSLSKHGSPPHCYAPVLGGDANMAKKALKLMRQDFKMLQRLEVSSVPHAANLCADLRLTVGSPMRLVMNAFDVCGYQLSQLTEGAMSMLSCMLQKFPDTKCVEDLHQRVRGKQNSRSNNQMTLGCLQNIVNFSEILESRSVKHPAMVTKETFRQYYRGTKASQFKEKKMMVAKKHKLPKIFSKMLNPQIQWSSITESSLVRSAACWSWVRAYIDQKLGDANIELQATLINQY